jgi:hypothetical protein
MRLNIEKNSKNKFQKKKEANLYCINQLLFLLPIVVNKGKRHAMPAIDLQRSVILEKCRLCPFDVKVQTHIGLFCRQNRGKTLKFSRNRKNVFYIQKSMRFIKCRRCR